GWLRACSMRGAPREGGACSMLGGIEKPSISRRLSNRLSVYGFGESAAKAGSTGNSPCKASWCRSGKAAEIASSMVEYSQVARRPIHAGNRGLSSPLDTEQTWPGQLFSEHSRSFRVLAIFSSNWQLEGA